MKIHFGTESTNWFVDTTASTYYRESKTGEGHVNIDAQYAPEPVPYQEALLPTEGGDELFAYFYGSEANPPYQQIRSGLITEPVTVLEA